MPALEALGKEFLKHPLITILDYNYYLTLHIHKTLTAVPTISLHFLNESAIVGFTN